MRERFLRSKRWKTAIGSQGTSTSSRIAIFRRNTRRRKRRRRRRKRRKRRRRKRRNISITTRRREKESIKRWSQENIRSQHLQSLAHLPSGFVWKNLIPNLLSWLEKCLLLILNLLS